MRGFATFVIACALIALLIPFPGLLWFSLTGIAVIWLATPLEPRNRAAKRARGKGF